MKYRQNLETEASRQTAAAVSEKRINRLKIYLKAHNNVHLIAIAQDLGIGLIVHPHFFLLFFYSFTVSRRDTIFIGFTFVEILKSSIKMKYLQSH